VIEDPSDVENHLTYQLVWRRRIGAIAQQKLVSTSAGEIQRRFRSLVGSVQFGSSTYIIELDYIWQPFDVTLLLGEIDRAIFVNIPRLDPLLIDLKVLEHSITNSSEYQPSKQSPPLLCAIVNSVHL
jgi:hypothetical protein